MQTLKSTLPRKTKRFHPNRGEKTITDQSQKKQCDINNIVKQFQKTGRLPENTKVPQYGDYSETPTLETAFKIAHNARDAFMALPSELRKLIDNDPSQLENFIADDDNLDLCYKYGLKNRPVDNNTVLDETNTNDKKE